MDLKETPTGAFVRHPWEIARAAFFLSELWRGGVLDGACRILDVGAGDAWFSERLTTEVPRAHVVCWDSGYGAAAPQATDRVAYTTARPSGTFDLLLMLDVVEHVPDDRAFLLDALDSAQPGAHVLFSVPAWPSLYSAHDEALGHFRRYTPGGARRLLRDCGLEVTRSGGLFHSLLAARFMQVKAVHRAGRRARRAQGTTELAWTAGPVLHRCVLGALQVDSAVSRVAADVGVNLPGLSWWALCRKS